MISDDLTDDLHVYVHLKGKELMFISICMIEDLALLEEQNKKKKKR